MGLRSVLHTALSGVSAAEVALQVVANNLANAQTAGFKASKASFVTQTPQTFSRGAGPADGSGGSNPVQVGSGVRVAQIVADFSQGSLETSGHPTSLATQGDGFFILQGPQGERLYTRDGSFGVNADGELVSAQGNRVLGFGVNGDFQIQPGELVPLRIPRGMQAAAEDGSAAALTSISIGRDGRVRGKFSDGRWRDLGQIRIARFANPSGLEGRAGNAYTSGVNSGMPIENSPGEAGAGEIIGGATERSNVDVAQSLVDLTLTSTYFRANLRVLDVAGDLIDELVRLRRRE